VALRLSPELVAVIRNEAEQAYPHECCGFLFGTATGDDKTGTAAEPARNERDDAAHHRYLISPAAYLEAERRAAARGEDIVGFYHSHPDHPADPSEFDRAHALPWCSYIIVSVRNGRAGDVRSWVLAANHERFGREPVHGVDPSALSEENHPCPS